MFADTAGDWAYQSYLKPDANVSNMKFGSSLAIDYDGNVIAAGAAQSGNITTPEDAGIVYLFSRSDTDDWTQQASIETENGDANDYFGSDIDLNDTGDGLIITASREDSAQTGLTDTTYDASDNTSDSSGAAYLYAWNGSNWGLEQYFKASNAETSDYFGSEVAISGDGLTIAVSASGEDSCSAGVDGDETDNDCKKSSAVYLFKKASGEWSQEHYIKSDEPTDYSTFGDAIDMDESGEKLIINERVTVK